MQRRNVTTAVVFLAALVVFLGSDGYFTFLEDETSIVTAARRPAAETIRLFWSGRGQHEHPPLSDLIFHFWLPVAGPVPWLLRLPSVLFYLAGLYLLALSAEILAGAHAFFPALSVGLLWPFGFHFGRMAGWYAFSFLLAAAMTLAYLRYVGKPGWRRLLLFILAAGLLVYSNYFGWALAGCLALDICFRRRSDAKVFILSTVGILVLAYMPLWRVFLREVLTGTHFSNGSPAVSRMANAVYNFYSLMVSESVAPWFWYWSVPTSIAIVVSIVVTAALLSKQNRAFLIYFCLLFGAMAALDIIGTKRLLLISGWLLLSFSVALTNRTKTRARRVLVLSLGFIAAVGWIGIVTRRFYAAPHFIEPWAEIAGEIPSAIQHGEVIVTNSPSFLFYANYALQKNGMLAGSFLPGWVDDPRIVNVEQWTDAGLPNASAVFFVNGVNVSLAEQTSKIEVWLRSNCMSVGTRRLIPDSGYELKTRFFKTAGQKDFRISLEHYLCSPHGLSANAGLHGTG